MSAGVHAREGAEVSFRDVTIKIPNRGCDLGCEWRHAPEAWAELFEKSQLDEFCHPKKKGDFRLLDEALWRVPHALGWGADEKVSIEKHLNSKGIKSFVPELRFRKCFSCFGIPMLSIYVPYGHYERFAHRHEHVYFTYSCMAMLRKQTNDYYYYWISIINWNLIIMCTFLIEWIITLLVDWLFWFYGITTFVGYFMSDPFLCK